MFITAVFFSFSANAFVLGDIQLSSHLGQPLNSWIAIADIDDTELAQFKISLADIGEYRKLGLQYPSTLHLASEVVLVAKKTFIHLFTTSSIEEPFVDLLLKVKSTDGMLMMVYTLLLDPPSYSLEGVAITGKIFQPISPMSRNASAVAVEGAGNIQQHKKIVKVGDSNDFSGIKLTMSPDISNFARPVRVDSKETENFLQNELVVKKRLLEGLKSHMYEIQDSITSLRVRINPSVRSSPAAPTAFTGVSTVQSKSFSDTMYGVIAALLSKAILIASACVVVLVLYWKFRRRHVWQHGSLDDRGDESDEDNMLGDAPSSFSWKLVSVTDQSSFVHDQKNSLPDAPVLVKPALLFDSTVSLHDTQSNEPTIPPVYDLLIKANRYMRSGQEAQAEEILLQALELNTSNHYVYQALLKIYAKRGDKVSFEGIFKKIKEMENRVLLDEAVALGKAVDPVNPCYA